MGFYFDRVDAGVTIVQYTNGNCTGPSTTYAGILTDYCNVFTDTNSQSFQFTCSNGPYDFPLNGQYVIETNYNSTVSNCESYAYELAVGYYNGFCFTNIDNPSYGSYSFVCAADGTSEFVAYSDSNCQSVLFSNDLNECYSSLVNGVAQTYQFQCQTVEDYSDTYAYVKVYGGNTCEDDKLSNIAGYRYGECIDYYNGQTVVSKKYTCTGKIRLRTVGTRI